MPDPSRIDEQLRDRALQQAFAGDDIGARQTIGGMVDRECLGVAWKGILCIQSDRGDVQGVKDTILACPDDSLLVSPDYHQVPLHFARAVNVTGAIEIAQTMGPRGTLSRMMIPLVLMKKGDCVGARDAASHINDETQRSMIVTMVDEDQRKHERSEPSSQH